MSTTRKKLFLTPAELVPMEFYFFPLDASFSNMPVVKQERKIITELLKSNGGVVLEKQGDFTIPLGHELAKENYPCFEEVYSFKFVLDCIENNQILKLASYRLNRLVMYDDNFDPNVVLEHKQEWTFWLDSPLNTFVPRPFRLTQERMAPMHFFLQPFPLGVPKTELDGLKEEIRTLACKIDTACGRVCSCMDDYAIRLGFAHLKHYYPQDVEIFGHNYIDDVLKSERFPKLADYRLFKTLYDDDCNPDEVLWQRKKWSDYKLKPVKPIVSPISVSRLSDVASPPTEHEEPSGQSSPPRQESEIEEETVKNAPNRTSHVTEKKERQPDFSSAEQAAILKYIRDKNAYGRVGGNALWHEMERDGICPGRTFHSLRNHFVKKLQHLIHTFRKVLTPKQIEHFRLKKPIEDEAKSQPSRAEPRRNETRKGEDRVVELNKSRVVVVADVTSRAVPLDESELEGAPPSCPSTPGRQSVNDGEFLRASTKSSDDISRDVSPVASVTNSDQSDRVPYSPTHQMQKKKKSRRRNAYRTPYSKEDDLMIINFIVEVKGFESVKGKDLWGKMVRKSPLKRRTWQSLKERFRVHIYPNLHMYGLSDAVIDRFTRGWNYQRGLGGRPAHNVADTVSSASSDDESRTMPPLITWRPAHRDEPDRGRRRMKLPGAVVHPAFLYGTSSDESSENP